MITEVKTPLPERGDIAAELDAVTKARAYEATGADAVSGLAGPLTSATPSTTFAPSAAVDLPVLRRDFIVDRGQVWEAAEAGTAAVLLIVAILAATGSTTSSSVSGYGLDPLVEVHDLDETRRACKAGCTLVGIDNHDLVTMEVDLATTEYWRRRSARPCSPWRSGISTPVDAYRAALAAPTRSSSARPWYALPPRT